MPLPRMRTAAGVLAEIKAQDPSTEITMHYIRSVIKSGRIPVVQIGKKKLVDVDKFSDFLEEGTPVLEPEYGKIRAVK